MHMTGYTKLFGSIVASTIWREDDKTRIVWITMLAIANKHGEVESSLPGLADLSRITVEEARISIAKLESPDADSRSEEEEGRRVVKVPGGWRLVNHAKYRHKLSTDERREYLTQKKREARARKAGVNTASTNVNNGQHASTPSTQADAESKAAPEASAKEVKKERPSGYNVPECFAKVDGFTAALAAWIESRKKLKKPPTGYAIQLMVNKLAEHPQRALSALNKCIASGWQGFEWSWLDRDATTAAPKPLGHNLPALPGHRKPQQ